MPATAFPPKNGTASMKTVRYTVDYRGAKKRVDLFLAEHMLSLTRSHIKRLIESHRVTVNHVSVKAASRLKDGDVIELSVPPPREVCLEPEPIPLDIIFEDDAIIVVNKPAGMVVHPAAGNSTGTLVHGLLAHCSFLQGIGGMQRPGIVHRLDKGTSGLMVVAKSDWAHQNLSQQFKNHTVKKIYHALVYGCMNQDEGSIALEIGRHRADRKKMSIHTRKGRAALTFWKVRKRYNAFSLLDVCIKTGRTHQIRVHLSASHHPVVGDTLYGSKKCTTRIENEPIRRAICQLQRPFLHACLLGFCHPATGKYHEHRAALPEELHTLLTLLEKA